MTTTYNIHTLYETSAYYSKLIFLEDFHTDNKDESNPVFRVLTSSLPRNKDEYPNYYYVSRLDKETLDFYKCKEVTDTELICKFKDTYKELKEKELQGISSRIKKRFQELKVFIGSIENIKSHL